MHFDEMIKVSIVLYLVKFMCVIPTLTEQPFNCTAKFCRGPSTIL